MMRKGIIEHYREFLPVGEDDKIVSLYEGDTPLIRAYRLEAHIHPRLDLYPLCGASPDQLQGLVRNGDGQNQVVGILSLNGIITHWAEDLV